MLDGVEMLPEDLRPPKIALLQWIGETRNNFELRYESYCRALAELAAFYNRNGFRMVILKGYACALDWPKSEHRPCGDIDIWQFGQQKEADEALAEALGVKVDASHHYHTVFGWKGFMVENHYDFINVHAHRSSREMERVFKELGQDDSHYVEVDGEKIYLPSPNLHALFLIRHMSAHFAGASITLRQVLDWAFFAEKHTEAVDWPWLVGMLERFNMKEFFCCINAICVEDLGFPADIFPAVQPLHDLKERVLNDILEPEFTAAEPESFCKRVVFKYRRWRANAWKQDLCYGESRWSYFWHGVWAHLLKPASI